MKISVDDKARAKDTLGVYKKWFNGMKYFAMKVLPPKK